MSHFLVGWKAAPEATEGSWNLIADAMDPELAGTSLSTLEAMTNSKCCPCHIQEPGWCLGNIRIFHGTSGMVAGRFGKWKGGEETPL